MKRRTGVLSFAVFLVVGVGAPERAGAVRPFITDDARVVGDKLAQLESWLRLDGGSFQHWIFTAIGPSKTLELSLGGVYGATFGDGRRAEGSATGPIFQAKLLLHEAHTNSFPGIAIVIGAAFPVGVGAFAPPAWAGFAYAAVTQSLFPGERLLLHANLGFFSPSVAVQSPVLTWGLGAQLRTFAGLHAVMEVFSGDPYAISSGLAFQAGYRYIVSDRVQIDSTVGMGLVGEPRLPVWGSVGIRIVTKELW